MLESSNTDLYNSEMNTNKMFELDMEKYVLESVSNVSVVISYLNWDMSPNSTQSPYSQSLAILTLSARPSDKYWTKCKHE